MNDFDERDGNEFEDMDVADQVAYEDTGRPWGARAIKCPQCRRKHLTANPLPGQRSEGSAA